MTAATAPRAARERVVAELVAGGAIAVVRLPDATHALRAVDAIRAGGVRAIELTMTTPGASDILADVRRAFGDDVLAGMGSVLDGESTRRAIDAGARYIVSPVFRPAVIDEAHRLGVAAMPAGFTPTEIGPAFIRGVLAPMPFLRLMPTGGVTPDNVGEWLRAGAVAVGVGSALVDPKLVAAQDFAALTERARRMVAGVAAARGKAAER